MLLPAVKFECGIDCIPKISAWQWFKYDLVRNVLTSIGFDMLHARQKHILWRNLASIFWFRSAQFWGTYQGYRHSGQLTPDLRQTFYYPHGMGVVPRPTSRQVEPIRYNDATEDR